MFHLVVLLLLPINGDLGMAASNRSVIISWTISFSFLSKSPPFSKLYPHHFQNDISNGASTPSSFSPFHSRILGRYDLL